MKNILLIGKDFLEEEGFVSQCKALQIAHVCTTKMLKTSKEKEEGLFEGTKMIIPWNRSTNLSAQNLIIRAESALGTIDKAILYFDTAYFYTHYAQVEKNRAQIINDELITAYQNITKILLERFKVKKEGGLIFLLKEMDSNIRDSKMLPELSCPFIYTAQEAFIAFAEMITHQYSQNLSHPFVLARTKLVNDTDIARQLFKTLNNEKLEKALQKDMLRWIQIQNQSEGALRFYK